MPPIWLEVLEVSAKAMVQLCGVCLAGFLCASFPRNEPLLAKADVRVLARLSNNVFLPVLSVVVLGQSVDAQALRSSWQLLPAGLVATLLGFAVADSTAWAFGIASERMYRALRVAVAHPNAFALPLLLLRSLCEKPLLNRDFGGNAGQCKTRAAASMAVYLTAWHLCFWTYSMASLEGVAARAALNAATAADAAAAAKGERRSMLGEESAPKSRRTFAEYARRAALQPNIIGLFAGVALGVSPLSAALFRDGHASWLRPVGAALQTLGEPLVCATTLVMAASLWHGSRAAARANDAQPLDSVAAPRSRRQGRKLMAWFVLARLVFVPTIGLSVAHFVLRRGTLGLSKLDRFIILLQFAMPGAQTVLVTLSALGLTDLASDMASFYVVQYALSVVTVTAFAAWSLLLVYY